MPYIMTKKQEQMLEDYVPKGEGELASMYDDDVELENF